MAFGTLTYQAERPLLNAQQILPATLGAAAGLSMVAAVSPVAIFFVILSFRYLKTPSFKDVGAWAAAFFLSTGFWVAPAFSTPITSTLALIAIAAYGGAFSMIVFSVVSRIPALPKALHFSITWIIFEWLSAQLSLPIANLGISLVGTFLSGIVGMGSVIYGSIFLAGFAVTLNYVGSRFPTTALFAAASMIIPSDQMKTVPFDIYGVAHSPNPKTKWETGAAAQNFAALIEFSQDRPEGSLLVWPEGAVNTTFDEAEAIESIPDDLMPILFGFTKQIPGTQSYLNSAILLSKDGIQTSEKSVLFPFLEQQFFSSPKYGLKTGVRDRMTFKGFTVQPLICYEMAFPITRTEIKGVDAIIVLASDAGFLSFGSGTFFDKIRAIRSLEAGVPVIRVSDTPNWRSQ